MQMIVQLAPASEIELTRTGLLHAVKVGYIHVIFVVSSLKESLNATVLVFSCITAIMKR